jgi:tungstate transport system ATP-binding protein
MVDAPVFELRDVRQRYGDREVLRVDALRISRGETLVVMGPNGSGKSTLLRLLMFLERPGTGSVVFDGQPEPDLAQRRAITLCFQKPNLFDRSVRANVLLGADIRNGRPTDDDRRRADDALARLGIAHLADAPARGLSSGEAQRVAIARALVCAPRVLLLDEPTANLDPAAILAVETALADVKARGATLIWVTHQLHQARRVADRVALLLDNALAGVYPANDFLAAATGDLRADAFASGALAW